jgi:hypothetical protein
VNKLSPDIQIEFFKLLNEETSVQDFERWAYANKNLEAYLDEADYLDFISLNFMDSHFKHEMKKIVDRYLGYGEFEKRKLKKILNDIIAKNAGFAKSLIATYNLYCHGCTFLGNIGLGYGLTFSDYFYDYKDWESLTSSERNNRINNIYAGVKAEAKKVLYCIEKEKIVFTGIADEMGRYSFINNRTDEEKAITGYLRSEL